MIKTTLSFSNSEIIETFEFNSENEKAAFIAGIDLSVSEFPETAEFTDDDVKDYSESELSKFIEGLDWGDGFSDYEVKD